MKADDFIYLVKTHYERDEERFRSCVLQIASISSEGVRENLHRLINASTKRVQQFPKESQDLIEERIINDEVDNLVLPQENLEVLNQVRREYDYRQKLREHNLVNANKLLFIGPPGTGKTMTASLIAKRLGLPLYVIQLDRIIRSFLGETATCFRKIFNVISNFPGVFLLDEFDAIGASRTLDKQTDVAEMRRATNSLLQFMESQIHPDSIVVATTNMGQLLDPAIHRRFDKVIQFHNFNRIPDLVLLIGKLFKAHAIDVAVIEYLANRFNGQSPAEICMICNGLLKQMIINDAKTITMEDARNV